MVRICPHCDVRLENVRCQRCFSLQSPGTFACVRCGHSLELEPLLDASDAPCPRCTRPLEVVPGEDTRLHECPRCGGMFVPREALAEILCSAEIGGALREGPPRQPRESGGGWSVDAGLAPGLDVVRYVPCPLCHTSMNRVNFGKVSGVIVDVCKMHGTWFDAGELTSVVAFASAGGLVKTRAREADEKRERRAHDAAAHAEFVKPDMSDRFRDRTEEWRDYLRLLFHW